MIHWTIKIKPIAVAAVFVVPAFMGFVPGARVLGCAWL
jgi:hypothetical protein